MFTRIRQMLSSSKPSPSDESRDFIKNLSPSFIWVLAIGIRGTPAIPAVYDSSAWDVIAAHRIELTDIGDDDSIFPFNYKHEGRQIMPFFSSEERAQQFLAGKSWGDTSFFQPYRLLAGFVATPENDMFDLLFDAGFSTARRLSHEERLLLRALSTAG